MKLQRTSDRLGGCPVGWKTAAAVWLASALLIAAPERALAQCVTSGTTITCMGLETNQQTVDPGFSLILPDGGNELFTFGTAVVITGPGSSIDVGNGAELSTDDGSTGAAIQQTGVSGVTITVRSGGRIYAADSLTTHDAIDGVNGVVPNANGTPDTTLIVEAGGSLEAEIGKLLSRESDDQRFSVCGSPWHIG